MNASSRSVGSSLLVTQGTFIAWTIRLFVPAFARTSDLGFAPCTVVSLHLAHLYSEGRMRFYQHVATNGIGNFQAQRFVETETMILPRNEVLLERLIEVLASLTTSTYADQIANLHHTRDLLLPKLISGELEVPVSLERSATENHEMHALSSGVSCK